ncbi:unnamed protein product, partial [Ascophyllum nodosum]
DSKERDLHGEGVSAQRQGWRADRLQGQLPDCRQRLPQMEGTSGAQQVPDHSGRHPVQQAAGERPEGRRVLLRHPEGPVQDPQAPSSLPLERGHRQRVLHVLHPA